MERERLIKRLRGRWTEGEIDGEGETGEETEGEIETDEETGREMDREIDGEGETDEQTGRESNINTCDWGGRGTY